MAPKLPIGHRLVEFDELDSTNDEAQRRAAMGEAGPLWIWARSQSAGRGRRGRQWVSPPGNLYVSHLIAVSASPPVAAQVGFVAALAICDLAMSILADQWRDQIELKWPNDVLLAGSKFSGILAETASPASFAGLRIILGCGINLAYAPEDTPYPVTTLAKHGASVTVEEALSRFSFRLQHWLDLWAAGEGFDHIRRAWLAHAIGLGKRFIADQGVEGTFTGLAPDGALILTLANGTTRSIHSGEVRLRPAQPATAGSA